MRFDVLTLFPEMFPGYLGQSLLRRAIDRGLVSVQVHDIRDWGVGKHRQVDDRPYGGGPGMVLMVEPVVHCVEAVQAQAETPALVVMLTPQGERLTQKRVQQLASHPRLILLCGRYEGFDDRVRELLQPLELSIGDYVLNGGEVGAMVVVDSVVRLVPGVLGDEESHKQDSFSTPEGWLEFGQFTRPREFRGLAVPEILLNGHHAQISAWRREQSLLKTRSRRSDLLREEFDVGPPQGTASAPSGSGSSRGGPFRHEEDASIPERKAEHSAEELQDGAGRSGDAIRTGRARPVGPEPVSHEPSPPSAAAHTADSESCGPLPAARGARDYEPRDPSVGREIEPEGRAP